jgi:hypothetical protein
VSTRLVPSHKPQAGQAGGFPIPGVMTVVHEMADRMTASAIAPHSNGGEAKVAPTVIRELAAGPVLRRAPSLRIQRPAGRVTCRRSAVVVVYRVA